VPTIAADTSIENFLRKFPLDSATQVVATDMGEPLALPKQ